MVDVSTNPLIGSNLGTLPQPTQPPVVGQFRGVKQAQAEMSQEADRVGSAQIEYQTATNALRRAQQGLSQAQAEQNALRTDLQSAQGELQSANQQLQQAQVQAQQFQNQLATARQEMQAKISQSETDYQQALRDLEAERMKSLVQPVQAQPSVQQPVTQPVVKQLVTQPSVQPTPQPVAPVAERPAFTAFDLSNIYRENPDKTIPMIRQLFPKYGELFPSYVLGLSYGGQSDNPFTSNEYGTPTLKKPENYNSLAVMSIPDLNNVLNNVTSRGYQIYDKNAFEYQNKRFSKADLAKALAVRIFEENN